MATECANLRKSFEGLSNEVRSVLEADPLSGHVFLFLNRRATQVKVLMWTRGGFTIVHKRLERGRFTFPKRVTTDAVRVEIDAHELAMPARGSRTGGRALVSAMESDAFGEPAGRDAIKKDGRVITGPLTW